MTTRPYIAAVVLVAGLAGSAWASPSPTGVAAASKGVKIVSAYSGDADSDGAVDRVYATFSRAVKGRPKASAFAVAGYRVTGKPRARGKKVTLQVVERPGCDVGAAPKVTFKGRGLKAGGRSVPRSKIDMGRRNRSFPRITCALTADRDRDGRLDTLALTYSKNVRNRPVVAGGGPFSLEGYSVASVGRARGRSLELRVKERSTPDTGARPAVLYKRPTGKAIYAVRSGRTQAFSGNFKAVRDRIAPTLVSARTLDTDADGSLDGLTSAWTEPVSASGGFAVAGANVSATRASQQTVDLNINEGAHSTGGRPNLSYGANSVRDESGNHAAAGSTTPTDSAPPVLLSARTADRGGSAGRVDTVSVGFSETVSHAADSDGGYPFAVSGYGLAAVGGASGSTIDLSLNEGPGPDTGARPAVAYARGQGAPVLDGAGNEATGRAFPGTTDGVAPLLLSAKTLDNDLNGRLDTVRFAFSEPVSHGAEGGGGSFSAAGLAPATAQAANGSSVDLALSEAGLPNTGLRPMASYSRDGANDVIDGSGNPAASASVPAADGAAPVLVSATTGDSNPQNGRLDRIALSFSEDVSHARDTAAPFSLDPSGRALAAVDGASGDDVSLELQEGAAADTGDAPAVGYTGAGTPVRDVSGNESPVRSYPGLTRDAAAPRLEAARTGDGDTDGQIDRVDVVYSEAVTATNGFTVSGRTIQSTSITGNSVRLAFADSGTSDSDARPGVTYSPGDVADIPEGPGDTAQAGQSFNVGSAQDGAGPVIVAARTLDTNANAILDGVRATFSEPVAHPSDVAAPFSLGIAQRAEQSVSDPQGADQDELTVTVAEATAPDGGFRPAVDVLAGGDVRDAATPSNPAVALTFSNTADGVAPRLVSAQLGEQPGVGSCGASPPQDGRLDCVSARFSEPVSHPGDPSSPFALSLDNFTVSQFPLVNQSDTIDLPLNTGAAPDRDRGSNITYSAPTGVTRVSDPAGNDALDFTLPAARACTDLVNDGSPAEDNDTRLTAATLPVLEPSLQRRCAFDDDWYRLATTATGDRVRASVRPSAVLNPEIRLYDSAGTEVAVADSSAQGETEELDVTGLSPSTDYYLRVAAAGDAEGPYCMALSNTAVEPSCGPLAGELILTEGRFEGAPGQRFLEIKNVSDFGLDTATADLSLRIGPGGNPIASCDLVVPGGEGSILDAGDYAVITDSSGPGPYRCAGLDGLPQGGTLVSLDAEGSLIDSVDFTGLLTSPLTAGALARAQARARGERRERQRPAQLVPHLGRRQPRGRGRRLRRVPRERDPVRPRDQWP